MKIDAEKHNLVRVLILKILAPQHPNRVDSVLIRRVLADFGYPISDHSLRSYLAYLEERGCIKTDERRQYDILMASITAKGLDILDGRLAESGLELD